jgi:hypothetical protein
MHPLDPLAGITLAQRRHDLDAALAEASRRHAAMDIRPSRPSLAARLRAVVTGRRVVQAPPVTAPPPVHRTSRASAGGCTSARPAGRS